MARPVNVRLRWRRTSTPFALAALTGRARAVGRTAALSVTQSATIAGSFAMTVDNLDPISAAEYATRTTNADRAAYLNSVLVGPVTVRIVDASNAARASTAAPSPWASTVAGNVVPAPIPGGLVVTSGGAVGAGWRLQYVGANGRIVQATFGVLGSGRQLEWSRPTFDAGVTGQIGAVSIVPSLDGWPTPTMLDDGPFFLPSLNRWDGAAELSSGPFFMPSLNRWQPESAAQYLTWSSGDNIAWTAGDRLRWG